MGQCFFGGIVSLIRSVILDIKNNVGQIDFFSIFEQVHLGDVAESMRFFDSDPC